MIRRLPIIPTILVLIAVGMMIRLGFWQLDRMDQKEALLASYAAAAADTRIVDWPRDKAQAEAMLYRRARLSCAAVSGSSSIAGRNGEGKSGLAQVATCHLADGGKALIALGWSRDPAVRNWPGGEVVGTIAPGPRLVADPPLAGLETNARPDPRDIPNNHFAYAVQWFLFAITALVIYALAVRKHLAGRREGG
jgi:surfeit locus 1 family protein